MKKVLVFGGAGMIGSRFIKLNSEKFEFNSPSAEEIDILNKDQVLKTIEQFNPDYMINFAAYTNVEEAENQKDDKNGVCFKINAIGARNVAEAAKEFKKHHTFISTEYVFDGKKEQAPYTEEDNPDPINWYGETKFIGEQYVTETEGINLIMRISMPFSPFYELKKDVARFFLGQLKGGQQVRAIEDQRITPTLVDDLSAGLVALLENSTEGIYNVCSTDSVSPLEFAKTLTEVFKLNYWLISPLTLDEYNRSKKAKLLRYSWLNPAKFEKDFGSQILHTVEQGLVIFKEEIDLT